MSNLKPKQIQIIKQLYPTVTTTVGTQCFDADGNEVTVDMTSVDAEIASSEYARDRASEYPSIGDQLDALWKGGDDAAAMLEQVMAVKSKYPKPE